MQSKVRSQILTPKKHANWSLFFLFALVVEAAALWVLFCCWYLFCGLDHEKHWKNMSFNTEQGKLDGEKSWTEWFTILYNKELIKVILWCLAPDSEAI